MARALLENLGLSHAAAIVYECLLDCADASRRELAALVPDLSAAAIGHALTELTTTGFALETPHRRYAAVPPAVAVPSAVLARTERAAVVTNALSSLTSRFWAGRTSRDQPDFIEVVRDREQGYARWLQMDRLTQHRVRAFDRPPYITSPVEPNTREIESLRRGVRFQIVYSEEAIAIPGRWPVLLEEFAAGEEARTSRELPAKLTVFDDFAAIISLAGGDADQAGSTALMIVHESPLLDALGQLFDMVWERSQPLSHVSVTTDDDDAELIRMLAAGFPDETIRRHLAVSASTVQRRIHRLFESVGAGSRFQAGYALGARSAREADHDRS